MLNFQGKQVSLYQFDNPDAILIRDGKLFDYPVETSMIEEKEIHKSCFELKDEELAVFRRRKIGFIFQNYNLVPILNVYENIVLPIQLDGEKPDRRFIQEIMEMLGIQNKKNSMPNQLSGGQQQRVAIARALASKPAIILLMSQQEILTPGQVRRFWDF